MISHRRLKSHVREFYSSPFRVAGEIVKRFQPAGPRGESAKICASASRQFSELPRAGAVTIEVCSKKDLDKIGCTQYWLLL